MADPVDTISVSQTIQKLQGKVAVVTGGASGIGEATTRKFTLHGARVMVITDVQDSKGQNVVASISPDHSIYIHCDITDDDQVKILVESTVKIYGRLDIMFSNAGIGSASKQIVMDLNLFLIHAQRARQLSFRFYGMDESHCSSGMVIGFMGRIFYYDEHMEEI
ncbi:hypothetical protein ACFX11_046814 [Malus domestica]